MRLKTIVALTDFSAQAEHSLERAALMARAHEVLNDHPVNQARRARGKLPANERAAITERIDLIEAGTATWTPQNLADRTFFHKRAEIDNLSRLVFADRQAVSSSVAGIHEARGGAAAGDDVREGRLGEMAGEGKGWLRGPSPARQTAP